MGSEKREYRYRFWCDDHGDEIIIFTHNLTKKELHREFLRWCDGIDEEVEQLIKIDSAGYYEI